VLVDEAKRQLAAILAALGNDTAAGTPVIGLEPACVFVFKDARLNRFPQDARAGRLASQVTHFSDFVLREARLTARDREPASTGIATTMRSSAWRPRSPCSRPLAPGRLLVNAGDRATSTFGTTA
jgi:hypothetical protein